MRILSILAPFCLAVMLAAPALKARFYLSDIYVYFLPFGIFLLANVYFNLFFNTRFYKHFTVSLNYLFIILAVGFSFLIGNFQNQLLLLKILMNCGLAVVIVTFPWNRRLLHYFFVSSAIIGCALAIYTILFLGTNTALLLASDEEKLGYITVSVVMGFGCIASLYLLFTRFNIFHLALFSVSWVGMALGRGRGALLSCVLVSLIYLLFILMQRRRTIALKTKVYVIGFVAVLTPFVFNKIISLGSNQRKLTRLIFDFDAELGEGGRGVLMEEAIDKIQSSPIFGNGLGEYMMYGGHPHNIFLQYGVDGGFVAMFFLFIFIVRVAYIGTKNFSSDMPGDVNIACVTFGFFAFMMGNMLKSGDAYLGREWFIASTLPLVFFLIVSARKRLS